MENSYNLKSGELDKIHKTIQLEDNICGNCGKNLGIFGGMTWDVDGHPWCTECIEKDITNNNK